MDRVVRDESVGKPDIGCGRFVTRGTVPLGSDHPT
jgi:hypothetical protein